MRSISFGLATVALVLVACGGEAVAPPATPAVPVATAPAPVETAPAPVAEAPKAPRLSMAEMQTKTGDGIAAALNAHDAKKVASFYTENAVIKFAGAPDTTGRDAIEKMWAKNFESVKSSKTSASRVFMKGDIAIVEWAWTGVHSGEMMGVKATEKPVGMQGVDVMWFSADGLVKEQHTYADMGTIASQIGASKQKARAVPTLGGAPTVVVSTNAADETKNVEVSKKMFGAFEKKNDADFIGNSSDDIAWDDLSTPETMKGKAAGKKFFSDMTKAFPDVKVEPTNSWGIGDFVISENTMTGTHKGAFMGVQPTKKSVNLHSLDIIQMKDGKAVKGWTYANGGEMMMQLGLIPQPGAAKADAKPATTTAAPAKADAKPATTTAAPAKK